MEPHCPWAALRAWSGPPNVDWCEESMCSWVMEPANTWSNLAFIAVAALLYVISRNEQQRTLRFFATVAFWVGMTSLVYHASLTFVTQVFDFFGMYFFFVLIILLNAIRLRLLDARHLFRALWPLIGAFTLITILVAKLGLPIQGIIALLLVVALGLEAVAAFRAKFQGTHRYLLAAIVSIGVAASFSAADVSRTFCDPNDHWIQGHAIWHVLASIGIAFSYFHYRQFKAQFV